MTWVDKSKSFICPDDREGRSLYLYNIHCLEATLQKTETPVNFDQISFCICLKKIIRFFFSSASEF